MSVSNPREVPAAHAIIRRLCALQAHVASEVDGYDSAADCFCGDEGFWPLTNADAYRNEGKAVEFIETATLNAIKARKQAPQPLFVESAEMRALAETFVAGLGVGNRELMLQNLTFVRVASDGLRALHAALIDACTADRLAALGDPHGKEEPC